MTKRILIVGGGTAGWITAGYLARTLGAQARDGVRITLVESADIGILGVGEGTFPTIRKTLRRIGVNETDLIRECSASFKQGAKFAHWRYSPGSGAPDHYLHSFQITHEPTGLDLLPYWLLGVAGNHINWDEVNTPQKRVADAARAPKLITHSDFQAPLNYAYHFDAVKLAQFLRKQAVASGVRHLVDTVDAVNLTEDGSIRSVTGRAHGELDADLFIDCTGFRAQLIGAALGVPYKSCRSVLFCDTALAMQVPHDRPDSPIASYTIATAHESGWIWDIALDNRRGIGNVYSSAHADEVRAEQILRDYIGKASEGLPARKISFEAGYREINWKKNCIAIGLSSGFFEPLEATGIMFTEVAAVMLSNLFPWGGDLEIAAKQYNQIMLRRYERALNFIKLHYCISERRDSQFWRDNVDAASIPDSLLELLRMWRYRPPDSIDIDPNVDIFAEASWQYVLYGMGYQTDLRPRAGVLRFYDEAREAFAQIRRQAEFACQTLPTNRELLDTARVRAFGPSP
ncbi:MAG: tryptophan halogenase [Gammaproteobacteria bacterium]|nr:tryptophan halogenase [Gammaproteobacteria bacterium]